MPLKSSPNNVNDNLSQKKIQERCIQNAVNTELDAYVRFFHNQPSLHNPQSIHTIKQQVLMTLGTWEGGNQSFIDMDSDAIEAAVEAEIRRRLTEKEVREHEGTRQMVEAMAPLFKGISVPESAWVRK